jgi:hypothetical protein
MLSIMTKSKTINRIIKESMMFLMCVDYHCSDEVGMDMQENGELIKRNENKKRLA